MLRLINDLKCKIAVSFTTLCKNLCNDCYPHFFLFFLQIKWKYNIGTSRSFHRVYKYWPNTSFNTDCIVVAFLAMLAVTIIWCLQLLIICDSLNSAIYKYINFSFIFLVYFFYYESIVKVTIMYNIVYIRFPMTLFVINVLQIKICFMVLLNNCNWQVSCNGSVYYHSGCSIERKCSWTLSKSLTVTIYFYTSHKQSLWRPVYIVCGGK